MSADGTAGSEVARATSLPARGVVLLVRACAALSALLVLVMLAIVCYAVLQRYVLHTPLLWGDEVLGHLLVLFVMLGVADVLLGKGHIAMDVVSSRVGPRLGGWLALWADLAVLAFAAVLGWSTWKSVRFAYEFGSYTVGHIEIATWIPQLPVLAGSALLALVALARILGSVRRRGPR
jgi:C4-dicarboxylate transporter DctQ subunit